MKNYDDIINLERPISKHPKLSNEARAAQFAPFAALTGYDDEIKETARLTSNKKIIDEDQKIILSNKLTYLNNHLLDNPEIEIKYFKNDTKKSGGEYLTKKTKIKKIDTIHETIILLDKKQISFDNIIDINGEIFENIDEWGVIWKKY